MMNRIFTRVVVSVVCAVVMGVLYSTGVLK